MPKFCLHYQQDQVSHVSIGFTKVLTSSKKKKDGTIEDPLRNQLMRFVESLGSELEFPVEDYIRKLQLLQKNWEELHEICVHPPL